MCLSRMIVTLSSPFILQNNVILYVKKYCLVVEFLSCGILSVDVLFCDIFPWTYVCIQRKSRFSAIIIIINTANTIYY